MTTLTLRLLTPEIVLIAAAVAIYFGGAFYDARRVWGWIAGGAVAMAAAALWMQHGPAAAGGSLQLDSLAWHGRWLALGFGVLFVLLASRPLATDDASEYVGSMLLTIAGLMLVVGAGELVLLFVGLELISIPTYVLLYLGRRGGCRHGRDGEHETLRSISEGAEFQEAAVKYFFLSVLSSAILLYGLSFLYGVAGSTDLAAVRAVLGDAAALPTGYAAFAKLAMVLIFAGLCFRIAAVPFHFYAPDVYQGTTNPNAALLSVVPKAAGLAVMVRILVVAMPGMAPYSWRMVLVVSVLTMSLGNVLALWQDNLRRLLAYSSIAHAGYMLIGLAVVLATGNAPSQWNGLTAIGFYLAVYAAATIGVFAVLEHLGRPERPIEGVEELAGLGRTRPAAAVLLAVFLFSLAGVPIFAGFWGKLLLFGSALSVGGDAQWWFTGLAIVGVLNAVVAAAYYLRIVALMYFRTPLATPRAEGGVGAWWAAVACALLVVVVGLYPGPLMREAEEASQLDQERLSIRTATPVCPAVWSGGSPSTTMPHTTTSQRNGIRKSVACS